MHFKKKLYHIIHTIKVTSYKMVWIMIVDVKKFSYMVWIVKVDGRILVGIVIVDADILEMVWIVEVEADFLVWIMLVERMNYNCWWRYELWLGLLSAKKWNKNVNA